MHLAHGVHRMVGSAQTAQRRFGHDKEHGFHLAAARGARLEVLGVVCIVHRDADGLEHFAGLIGGIQDRTALLLGGTAQIAVAGVADVTDRQDEGRMALEPFVHIAVEAQPVLHTVKSGLEPGAEGTGKRCRGPAHRHACAGIDADHAVVFAAACGVLEAERHLIRRALHGFQHLLCLRIVAHEHKVGALVLLEDGQHLGQLACLHHHEHKVIAVVRGQGVDGLHTVHRGFPLHPVADGQALLVDYFLPLTARKQRDNVLFVLDQRMSQLAAQNARTVNQDSHTIASFGRFPGLLFQKGEKALLFIRSAFHALHFIAGGIDGVAQLLLVQFLLRLDDRLALGVGRRHLLRLREGLAHSIVDMALAHAAHHTIYIYSCFNHFIPLQCLHALHGLRRFVREC